MGFVGALLGVWAENKREERQRKGVKYWKRAEKTGTKRKLLESQGTAKKKGGKREEKNV